MADLQTDITRTICRAAKGPQGCSCALSDRKNACCDSLLMQTRHIFHLMGISVLDAEMLAAGKATVRKKPVRKQRDGIVASSPTSPPPPKPKR